MALDGPTQLTAALGRARGKSSRMRSLGLLEALVYTRLHNPDKDDTAKRRKYVLFVLKTVLTTFGDPEPEGRMPLHEAIKAMLDALDTYLYDTRGGSLYLAYQTASLVIQDLLPHEAGAITRVRPLRHEHLRRLLHLIGRSHLTVRHLEIDGVATFARPNFQPSQSMKSLRMAHDSRLMHLHGNLAQGSDANVAFALAMLLAPGLRILIDELLQLDDVDWTLRDLNNDVTNGVRPELTLEFFWKIAMDTDYTGAEVLQSVVNRTGWGRLRMDFPGFSAVLVHSYAAADENFTRQPAFTQHVAWVAARELMS